LTVYTLWGGSWFDRSPVDFRTAWQFLNVPNLRHYYVGLRVSVILWRGCSH